MVIYLLRISRVIYHTSVLLTSRKVIRLGLSPTGGIWLHTIWATGSLTEDPWRARTLLREKTTFIQAPPRFSDGLEYGSKKISNGAIGRIFDTIKFDVTVPNLKEWSLVNICRIFTYVKRSEWILTGANPSAASTVIPKSLFARLKRPSITLGSAK